MKSSLLFVFLFWSLLTFSQDSDRKLLNGIVISDSLDVAGITVKNKTTDSFSITDAKGNFSLSVREKDTLQFSGVAFNSSYLVITLSHLSEEVIKVRLSVKVNELDEVVVRPYILTGNLEADTKKIKVKTVDLNLHPAAISVAGVRDDKVENALKKTMGTPGNDYNGVDFVQLAKKLGKLLFKKKSKAKK